MPKFYRYSWKQDQRTKNRIQHITLRQEKNYTTQQIPSMEAKTLNNSNTNQQDASTTYAILWVMLRLMRTYKTDEADGSILIKWKNNTSF
jgi:hypothetical protein